jgi:hypothetical protein
VGVDVKNPILAGFFGLNPLDFNFGTTSIQADLDVSGLTGAFSGTVVNADLNNTQQVVVPVPASLLLLGAGLLGVGALRRRI